MGIDVPGYLSEQQRKSSSELAPAWAALEELYNKKLWHQLTLRLDEFIKHPALLQGDALVKLYQNFIVDFENRINPLALAEIIVVVARHITDVDEALPFLEVLIWPTHNNFTPHHTDDMLIGPLADFLTHQQPTFWHAKRMPVTHFGKYLQSGRHPQFVENWLISVESVVVHVLDHLFDGKLLA